MARPGKVTPSEIEDAAYALVRAGGLDALTARGVADALGVSTQPVYSAWGSMAVLKARVTERIEQQIGAFLGQPEPGVPPLLSLGLRTLRLAYEEPTLFALTADRMRQVFRESPPPPLLHAMRADPRLARASDAELAHLNALLWIVTQGLAVLLRPADATSAEAAGLSLAEARSYLESAGEALVAALSP